MLKIRACTRARTTGFSLIEIAVALTLACLLYAIAAPAYQDWIAARTLANRAYTLQQTLNLARSEAMKRGVRVGVCPSSDGSTCGSYAGWSGAWIVFADENGNGETGDDPDIIRRETPLEHGVTITGNRPVAEYVSFTSFGHARMFNGALQMGTFAVCKAAQHRLDVVLANSGRARIEKTSTPCQ